ncbi:MAG TPA: type VI secretion system tip protein TssI/VgrG [Thermomonas sp.]|nr:type VI secretion system tip protein TssI/VgrG [Thermomonas sp.]
MPLSLSTSNRMYFLTLQDYGEDDLLIEEMSGHEAVSELFEFRLRLLSEHDDIDPRKIIGKWAILRIETFDTSYMGGERHWNGYVSRFSQTGRAPSPDGEGDLYTYECDIVPWFWMLTQHEDCRIFQNLSVPEIIDKIFEEFSYSDYLPELTGHHPRLEYCTQYNETSFAFISRLLEREGIHYYFRHSENGGESKHILVLTDNKDSNPALEPDELPFHHDGHAENFDAIRTLSRSEQMRTRKVTLHDWDYKRRGSVGENTPTVLDIGADHGLERYRYPGGFVSQSGLSDTETGKHLSKVLMEAEESSHLRYRGDSQIRTLVPGHTFTLYDHPFDEFNVEYMILSVWHHGRNNLTAGGGGGGDYGNEFTLQPHATVYRAPLTTRKGLVHGPQTAIVVGPAGEEIYTDELGRIKVRFHWDRKLSNQSTSMPDDKASCWIRVAQMWAGNGYGTMFIPRIGMEVVVDFLEGDPDRPIAVGCVYNGINKPPYTLPTDATKSTIKTLSSKGGGGSNELRFEDKKGSEEVFLQAQKALNVNVKADKHEYVGGNSDLKIDGKYTVGVKGDYHQVMYAEWANSSVGDMTLGTKSGLRLKATSNIDALSVAGNIVLGAQGGNIEAKATVAINLDGNMISLKAGSSSITMNPGMIQIQSPLVMINSGGSGTTVSMPSLSGTMNEAKGVEATKDGKVTDPVQQLQAQALRNAALEGQPFCAECAAARAAYRAMMA